MDTVQVASQQIKTMIDILGPSKVLQLIKSDLQDRIRSATSQTIIGSNSEDLEDLYAAMDHVRNLQCLSILLEEVSEDARKMNL